MHFELIPCLNCDMGHTHTTNVRLQIYTSKTAKRAPVCVSCYAKSWFLILPCFDSFGSRVSTCCCCCVFKAQPPVITLLAFPVKWKGNYLIIVLVRLVQNIAQTHIISCFFEIRVLVLLRFYFQRRTCISRLKLFLSKGKIQILNLLTNKLTNNSFNTNSIRLDL